MVLTVAAQIDKTNKLKILLVSPPQKTTYGKWKAPLQIPLGLAYLASAVPDEAVSILDMEADKFTQEMFAEFLRKNKFDLIGLR